MGYPLWQFYSYLTVEIPLLTMYLLAIVACICSSTKLMDTSFYNFIGFIGILDVCTYLVTLFTYRLGIYTPFNDFFGGMDESWGTFLTFIYASTFTLCAAREFATLGLALNRFSSLIYNNKKWSLRTFVVTVIISLVAGYCCNYYMWDTEVDYMKVDNDDDLGHFYFITLDPYERDWLNEMAVTVSWSIFCYTLTMGIYVLIGFHVLFGGAHPDVNKREFRLTLIAFIVHICNTFFFFNNIMGYRLDRNDFLVAMKAVKQGAPIIPFAHDLRSLSVPLFLVLLDSVMRRKILHPCGGGNDAKLSAKENKIPMA